MAQSPQNQFMMCEVCASAVPFTGDAETIACAQCGHKNHRRKPKSASKTLAYSLTALIFYLPANVFPFMTIELYGSKNSSTIWGGIVSLNESGSWPIALLVFFASMVIPFVKLAALFYLSLTVRRKTNSKFKTKLYYAVESIGRWSMLDIFLLAVLVAIMKLGPWTSVTPGIGSLMFALVVIFTMLASANFDPQLLWKEET